MRPPGEQPHRDHAASVLHAQNTVRQLRLFHSRAGTAHDVGLVFCAIVVEKIFPRSLLRRRSLADGQIFFIKRTGLHRRRELCRTLCAFGKNHQSSGLAVEAVHRPNRARRQKRGHAGFSRSIRCRQNALWLDTDDKVCVFKYDLHFLASRRFIIPHSGRKCKIDKRPD